MKYSKLLLINCIAALILAVTILPALAQPVLHSPSLKLQKPEIDQNMINNGLRSTLHLKVYRYTLGDSRPTLALSTLSSGFKHSLSATLILNSQPIVEGNEFSMVNSKKKRNTFFETTMMFNDKLQQFLSFFSRDKNTDNNAGTTKNNKDKSC